MKLHVYREDTLEKHDEIILNRISEVFFLKGMYGSEADGEGRSRG